MVCNLLAPMFSTVLLAYFIRKIFRGCKITISHYSKYALRVFISSNTFIYVFSSLQTSNATLAISLIAPSVNCKSTFSDFSISLYDNSMVHLKGNSVKNINKQCLTCCRIKLLTGSVRILYKSS